MQDKNSKFTFHKFHSLFFTFFAAAANHQKQICSDRKISPFTITTNYTHTYLHIKKECHVHWVTSWMLRWSSAWNGLSGDRKTGTGNGYQINSKNTSQKKQSWTKSNKSSFFPGSLPPAKFSRVTLSDKKSSDSYTFAVVVDADDINGWQWLRTRVQIKWWVKFSGFGLAWRF